MSRYQVPKLSWTKDWLIKCISFLFAVFLWYFVTGEDRVDMNVQIPVEIINMPRNLVISNHFKKQLDVTVSGPRGIIRKIAHQHTTRSIDLSDASPGNVVIRNELDSISFPRGVRVLRIQPTHIILLLDRLIQKELPIKYITQGKPPAEYELDRIILEPDKLILSGPQAILGSERLLKTRPIDLSDLTGPTIKQVPLDLLPEVAGLIGEPMVTAKVTLKEKIVSREIRKISVTIMDLNEKQRAVISPKMVRVKARLSLIMAKRHKSLNNLVEATVKAGGLIDGSYELPVRITPAPGVVIEQITPKTLQVKIKSK